MPAYYNEIDPKAAAWLRELIRQGLIADGEVDERSIVDVQPDDLRGFDQCHFFAGIGGWSAALRLAGWPDGRMAWTGSCPCQPFSSAGKGRGTEDARHLWPQFRRLIRQCRPAVVFGEQVASKAGRRWLAAVCADLEALAYRAAGADLCGPSVGAFDIRQRLWFVADTTRQRHERQRLQLQQRESREREPEAVRSGEARRLAEPCGQRRGSRERHVREQGGQPDASRSGADGELVNAVSARLEGHAGDVDNGHEPGRQRADAPRSVTAAGHAGFWSNAEWIPCTDGKWRAIEPGTFPLADGVPARVGRLRGYGNAIKPQVAAEVIGAYMEIA